MTGAASLAAALSDAQPSSERLLPPIRQELRLLPAAANHDGSPAWMVQDPVNNRFFRIAWIDFEILLRWSLGSAAAIAKSVSQDTTLAITAQDVAALQGFLEQHNLLQANSPAAAKRLEQRWAALKKTPF